MQHPTRTGFLLTLLAGAACASPVPMVRELRSEFGVKTLRAEQLRTVELGKLIEARAQCDAVDGNDRPEPWFSCVAVDRELDERLREKVEREYLGRFFDGVGPGGQPLLAQGCDGAAAATAVLPDLLALTSRDGAPFRWTPIPDWSSPAYPQPRRNATARLLDHVQAHGEALVACEDVEHLNALLDVYTTEIKEHWASTDLHTARRDGLEGTYRSAARLMAQWVRRHPEAATSMATDPSAPPVLQAAVAELGRVYACPTQAEALLGLMHSASAADRKRGCRCSLRSGHADPRLATARARLVAFDGWADERNAAPTRERTPLPKDRKLFVTPVAGLGIALEHLGRGRAREPYTARGTRDACFSAHDPERPSTALVIPKAFRGRASVRFFALTPGGSATHAGYVVRFDDRSGAPLACFATEARHVAAVEGCDIDTVGTAKAEALDGDGEPNGHGASASVRLRGVRAPGGAASIHIYAVAPSSKSTEAETVGIALSASRTFEPTTTSEPR